MKYRVYFTISNSYVTSVEADSRDEACEIVQDAINIDDDAFSYDREWYYGNNFIEEVSLENEWHGGNNFIEEVGLENEWHDGNNFIEEVGLENERQNNNV